MGLLDDIDHVRRGRDAQRFLDHDGEELAGYLISYMDGQEAARMVSDLKFAAQRLCQLGEACGVAALKMERVQK